MKKYDYFTDKTKGLLGNKNHDYGEAWRDMRVSSMTDIVLMKLIVKWRTLITLHMDLIRLFIQGNIIYFIYIYCK